MRLLITKVSKLVRNNTFFSGVTTFGTAFKEFHHFVLVYLMKNLLNSQGNKKRLQNSSIILEAKFPYEIMNKLLITHLSKFREC